MQTKRRISTKTLALVVAMNRRRRKQIAFHDFPTGFTGARIFPDNRLVQLSERMSWNLIDEKYAENFEGSENSTCLSFEKKETGAKTCL